MEIEKHFVAESMWTIHGVELNPNIKLPIKNVEELIELHNLIIKELADEGVLNIRSN